MTLWNFGLILKEVIFVIFLSETIFGQKIKCLMSSNVHVTDQIDDQVFYKFSDGTWPVTRQ